MAPDCAVRVKAVRPQRNDARGYRDVIAGGAAGLGQGSNLAHSLGKRKREEYSRRLPRAEAFAYQRFHWPRRWLGSIGSENGRGCGGGPRAVGSDPVAV